MAVSAQEWAANQMSTTSELQALYNLLQHPAVPQSTKIRAEEKIDRVYTIKEKVEDEVETFLQENPDKLPPGLNVDSRYAITVRRKT